MLNKIYSFKDDQIILTDTLIGENYSAFFIYDKTEEKWNKYLEYHIKVDDYFGTLATVLSLIMQTNKNIDNYSLRILKKIKDDLIFLQKHYRIIKK